MAPVLSVVGGVVEAGLELGGSGGGGGVAELVFELKRRLRLMLRCVAVREAEIVGRSIVRGMDIADRLMMDIDIDFTVDCNIFDVKLKSEGYISAWSGEGGPGNSVLCNDVHSTE